MNNPLPLEHAQTAPSGHEPESRREARRLALLTIVALVALIAARAMAALEGPVLAERLLYILAYVTGGYSGAVNGWAALRKGELNVDVLMLVAAAGAASIGAWLEGGVLLFLFSLSEALQTYALGRTEGAIHALMDLRPDVARRRLPGAEGGTEIVPVEALVPGDHVIVLPGERIPVDGLITAGESDVEQAAITGESVPVLKGQGDVVFAATLNGPGALDLRVTRAAGESTVARIIDMVREAQSSRAPTQRLIDRYGNRYAWLVIGGALLMMTLPTLLLDWPFRDAFYRAMTLLVVASPCALVISTPASYLSAIAAAARHGVLFKGGAYLEAAALVDRVAIDKTGTLTRGQPELTDVLPLDGGSADDLLALAAGVEARSEHLLAKAVVAGARARGVAPIEATQARALPGLGIQAVSRGEMITIGRARLFDEQGGLDEVSRAAAADLEARGRTTMLVAKGELVVGVLGLADEPRPHAAATIAALRAIGVGRIVMMTGDNEHVARAVAREVGIPDADVAAGLMPEDKVRLVERLAEEGPVAFVGDGVNDAPALAAASLGVAMGAGGSDVALETADVVLMGDRIGRLAYTFGLGRAARRVVAQNVTFALAVILVLVVTTIVRGVPLPLGVLGHEGSTVLVVLNGLRLLAYRPPADAASMGLPSAAPH
jgi:Cd2+/Zn2+-exporting ATPase